MTAAFPPPPLLLVLLLLLFPRSTAPFSLRKEQASQAYQLNTAKQVTIRLGTNLISGWMRQSNRRTRVISAGNRVRDSPTLRSHTKAPN